MQLVFRPLKYQTSSLITVYHQNAFYLTLWLLIPGGTLLTNCTSQHSNLLCSAGAQLHRTILAPVLLVWLSTHSSVLVTIS